MIPLALNMNYLSEEFARKTAEGFTAVSEKEGPYLIHCTEGKDRTGFVCMLAEALCGASCMEIADDCMETYRNYYKITEESEPEKYRTIREKNLDAMISFIADLSVYTERYLLEAGMSEEAMNRLIECIAE